MNFLSRQAEIEINHTTRAAGADSSEIEPLHFIKKYVVLIEQKVRV